MFGKKQKYKAWFFIKEHGTFRKRKKKKFNPLKPVIHYKNKAFCPIISEPSFTIGLWSNYFFDINGKQITIVDSNGKKEKVVKQLETYENNNDQEINANDLLYANEVIKQVFQSLEKRQIFINWIHLILVGGLTLLGGWILGTYIPISIAGG